MQDTIYLLNSPIIGGIDLSLQKQDVTPLLVQMPSSWNQPRTRIRIRFIGDFQLGDPGDLFYRKLWLGKTQLTFCSAQQIVANQGRCFVDEHDFCLYGDNLHAVFSRHQTGVGPTTYIGNSSGNTITAEQNRSAVPSTIELSRNDSPLIVDDDWNKFSVSFYGVSTKKIGFSVREFSVEKIS